MAQHAVPKEVDEFNGIEVQEKVIANWRTGILANVA
jgi:hypothetical protein